VVISIIGLLSSVVMASLNTARSKARDSKRIQDIRQIQLALELYKNDTVSYPSSGASRTNSCRTSVNLNTPFGTCIDISTGSFNTVNDTNYEYAIYLSLENRRTSGKVIRWDNTPGAGTTNSPGAPIDFNSKPYNYCIVGPKK
jgi:type II secretory pathway pseudopilin PulG